MFLTRLPLPDLNLSLVINWLLPSYYELMTLRFSRRETIYLPVRVNEKADWARFLGAGVGWEIRCEAV